MGCGLGQELRYLAADGVPGRYLLAVDLGDEMWESGLAMFKDRDTGMKDVQFRDGDVFDIRKVDGASQIKSLRGLTNVIIAAHFLHVFDWDEQIEVCKCLTELLKQQGRAPDTMIIGWCLGGRGEHIETSAKRQLFMHSLQSFQQMWTEISKDTGIEWSVKLEDRGIGESGIAGQKWLPRAPIWFFFTIQMCGQR